MVVNYVADPECRRRRSARRSSRSAAAAIAIKADVSDEADVAVDVRRTRSKAFGTLHIVVSNAGLQRDAAFDEMTLEQWNTVIGVNLTGQFLCAREAVARVQAARRSTARCRSRPARSSA